MEYLKEDQILLYEELCCLPVGEDEISKATIRFRENIRLANYIAYKFKEPCDNSLSKDDILQEAYLGLWKACLNFDESKGFEFSTYAVPMIRGQIFICLRSVEAVKTPRYLNDVNSELLKHGFTLPLTDDEVDLLVSEGKVSRNQIIRYSEYSVISIDTPIGEDNSKTYAEIIPDKRKFENELSEDEIEDIINTIILHIKPKYRDMIEEWLYSVVEGEVVTQETLGVKYNVSQAQVSRVINSSISIIKDHTKEVRNLFGMD